MHNEFFPQQANPSLESNTTQLALMTEFATVSEEATTAETSLGIGIALIPELPEVLEELIASARNLQGRGRQYRLFYGLVLLKIHSLLCKPGSGSFMQTVSEIGIKYNTARDYMAEAREFFYSERNGVRYEKECPDYTPDPSGPDPVQVAICAARRQVVEAEILHKNAPGNFNWAFKSVSLAQLPELKRAKQKLGNAAIQLLIIASQLPIAQFALYLQLMQADLHSTTATTQEVAHDLLAA